MIFVGMKECFKMLRAACTIAVIHAHLIDLIRGKDSHSDEILNRHGGTSILFNLPELHFLFAPGTIWIGTWRYKLFCVVIADRRSMAKLISPQTRVAMPVRLGLDSWR